MCLPGVTQFFDVFLSISLAHQISPPILEITVAKLSHFVLPRSNFTAKARSMELKSPTSSYLSLPNPRILPRTHFTCSLKSPETNLTSLNKISIQNENSNKTKDLTTIPTMADILSSSKAQNLDLQLKTVGPFFRITARNLVTKNELGRAEGLIRIWLRGKILHLDSIKLRRETLGMEKSIFGIGLFIGAVAIRYGYDCGCKVAELLAINDSDLYHSKLVRFYKRIGFKAEHEVSGSTMGDICHMLVWGGVGTRMVADVKELLIKWCSRFKPLDSTS